jgi:hypothetical protein
MRFVDKTPDPRKARTLSQGKTLKTNWHSIRDSLAAYETSQTGNEIHGSSANGAIDIGKRAAFWGIDRVLGA